MVGQRWTLLGVIGSGGTATVYEAVHRNGSRVAVKMLHAELHSDERIRRRFLAEGYAANLVQHEGAVKILDDGETDEGGAYLVMELLEGETLAARLLREVPLPPEQVLAWGIAVLEILASAHEHHVVHRDVKPSNIFTTRRGQVKLLDFGIARISADSAGDESLTQQGVALGTPAFMAPEQALGRLDEIGAATDVWGVGATLFQLLTGRPVQERKSAAATELELVAPPVRAFAPQLSPALAKVIDRALSLRRSDRWPTAQAMIRALELARDAPLAPSTSSPDTRTEEALRALPPALHSRRALALTTLALILILWAGLYVVHSARAASTSRPVAPAATGPTRQAPAVLAAVAPSATELTAGEVVLPTSAPKNSLAISQARPVAAVPRRTRSELTRLPLPGEPPAMPKAEAGDLDSMLDRRK